MDQKRRQIITVLVSAIFFILIAGAAIWWSNSQISKSYLDVVGNQAKGYASIAAQSLHLTDSRVAELKALDYNTMLKSPENVTLENLFASDTLRDTVDYAYLVIELPADEVRYYVTEENAFEYDAPVGTPLDIMWLLDVVVSPTLAPESGTVFPETERFAYHTDDDEAILKESPIYVVNDDEWGRHVCGYAPIYTVEGTFIGIVGVDLSTTSYDEHQNLVVTAIIATLLVVVLVMAGIFFLLYRQHKQDEMRLHVQEERYRILIDTTNILSFDYDPDTDVLTYSLYGKGNALREKRIESYMKNLDEVSAVDRTFIDDFRKDILSACENAGSYVFDLHVDMGHGVRWYKVHYASVADDRNHVYRVVGRLEDIQHEKEIERRADHDQLSGLYNRAGAEARINAALMHAAHPSAFILIDIDDFKRINDSMGHGAGDEVIAYVGQTLSTLFRRSDIAYRMGGDEFGVLIQAQDIKTVVSGKAEEIIRKVKDYSDSLNWEFPVSVSIGVATSESSTTLDSLYKPADEALYESKREGKNRFSIAD